MRRLFENTEIAFRIKSNLELSKAYYIFKIINRKFILKVGTSLMQLALKARIPIEGLIRKTIFNHFCAGVTEEDCISIIDKMYNNGNVYSVLDYSIEGNNKENQFDYAMNKTLKIIEFAKNKNNIPFVVFKPTAFGKFSIYQKLTEKKELTKEEINQWSRIVNRYDKVCKAAYNAGILILIDAEHTWIQDAADKLAENMMEKYNQNQPVVFNTIQCYRWDRLEYLKGLHKRSDEKKFYIGMKVVRGAYIEKERRRAIENGYKDPICATKKQTDNNYNNVIKYMIGNINKMAIFAGTHNENSSYILLDLMKEKKLENNHKYVWFSQLYGMSDNISYNLAKQGYNVAKYLPFGPVRYVIPYLIRRIKENSSVASEASRELNLLKSEIKRRKSVIKTTN